MWKIGPKKDISILKLHICNHLSFRGVCVTWRAAASSAKQLSQRSPLLVCLLRVDENCRSFPCPLHDRCLQAQSTWSFQKLHMLGFLSWLAVRDDLFFKRRNLSPFTGARVDLLRGNRTSISQVEVLSAPTDPNCIAILFFFLAELVLINGRLILFL